MENNQQSSGQETSSKKSPFDDLSKDELIQKCKSFLVLAQRAKQAKSDLQGEIDSYKIQLDKCVTEKEASQENVHTLQELVNSLTEQKLTFITELDTAQSKIKALHVLCSQNEKDISSFKDEISLRDKKVLEYSQTISSIDSELISLKRQNKRLVDENEQLINQLTELETRITEFNDIGLQQREQLKLLEDKIKTGGDNEKKIELLNKQLEELKSADEPSDRRDNESDVISKYETTIKEITELYESEKSKKEKANVKLRSYKDKILKCAACINQLKNSRHILSKTVKEYSENIPKWQNDIVIASKVLNDKMNDLSHENVTLKSTIEDLRKKLQGNFEDKKLKLRAEEHNSILSSYKQEVLRLIDENNSLVSKIREFSERENIMTTQINELNIHISRNLKDNEELKFTLENLRHENQNKEINNLETLNLQIKALESEKAIVVKDKLSIKESLIELEKQNEILTQQVSKLTKDIQSATNQLDTVVQEKLALEKRFKEDQDSEISDLQFQLADVEQQFNSLKKQFEDMQDLNGLLKEEIETLKLSLEQPNDDTENLSDVTASLQADVVKLETKLSAYKQENSSLLSEIKESRSKIKEYNNALSEFEDTKTKLLGYKTENSELLNEMKEINQVLKERGEAISKLQKAVAEMEKLIETLEKDRDSVNEQNTTLKKNLETLEHKLKDTEQVSLSVSEKCTMEKEKLVKDIIEKDSIIASMKEEIDKLKQHHSTDIQNEDTMSTSTISRAEEVSRMKDLDETFEEKYTKLRIFALKLKKKLNETAKQLQNSEQDKTKLEKMLGDKVSDNIVNVDQQQKEDNIEIDQIDGSNNVEINELKLKVNSLTDSLEAAEKKAVEAQSLKDQLEKLTQELNTEKDSHKTTKEYLEKTKRDIKKKSVLSLEMEDYERSMKELTAKMEEKKKKMIQMESTIDTQEGTITAMKTQIKLLEEQIRSEESQNRLVKEELQHSIDEKKENDNVIQIKIGIISKLEQELEDEKRKNEESVMEMTSLISEKEKIIMLLGEDKSELNTKVKRLEFKCGELNERLGLMNIELEDLKTEYTSYRVRAQAVLRQNQTIDHSQEEQLKEETAALKTQIEELTAKLNLTKSKEAEQTIAAETARRRATEAANEAARAQQRTTRLHADLARITHQLESERSQHNLQVTTLTQCYKSQIADLETKLQTETENLKKELTVAQVQLKAVKSKADDLNSNQYLLPVIAKDDGSDGELDINVSMIPREEGEGSESAPSPPLSKSFLSGGGGRRSPVPLGRLLEEGVPEDESLDASTLGLTPEQEVSDLRRKLLAQQQRVKHVTILLSESERECARMGQLSELLKSELRRIRGDSNATHNTEYMKNVTLKFLTLAPGDERCRLVPVIQKILSLTNDETHKIQAIAKGLDPNASRGWGSYLPWPGGSK